ncbi:hypothetical protein DM02DRAFT_623804 [Periconia macrospinosa]|uniref:Uncharacterized protein n=1 Tax=Periconia macrospinosa TaxID=97972 RepID=A0A2V1E5I8_9PLEO|nr:hypothetical protein DM02DRAFT_623804 [Periconia macrospinosa]
MPTITNTHVIAPWGYNLLPSQKDVQAAWKFQIFSSIVVVIISLPADFTFIFQRRFTYATVLFVLNSVRVLYRDNLYLLIFMLLFLFAGPVFALTEACITTASNLPGNLGCIFGPSSPYIYVIFLLQASFDCVCFVLCVYKMAKLSQLFRIGQGGGFMGVSREMLNGGFVYYIPNVIIQIATIILTQQKGSEAQFLLPPAADGVASAQALRITRSLWRSEQKRKYQIHALTNVTSSGEQSTNTKYPSTHRRTIDSGYPASSV